MPELTEADLTPGTELVWQAPSCDITTDDDYEPPQRGEIVDIVEETKHLVSDTLEQTLVVIEDTDGEEHRINMPGLIDGDWRANIVPSGDDDATPAPRTLDDDATVVLTERDDQPAVTDGGRDYFVTDAEIEAAIEQHDDPEHPDAHTVAEIRDALDAINADIVENWDLYADALDDGAHEIVHEDSDVIVLADHSGQFWSEQLDVTPGVEADEHGILHSIVVSLHHTAARTVCDHSWSAVDPVVIRKPADFCAGEAHVLREIARRTQETGSVARAVDQLATEVHGWPKGNWASLTGRNPSTVTRMTQPKE